MPFVLFHFDCTVNHEIITLTTKWHIVVELSPHSRVKDNSNISKLKILML